MLATGSQLRKIGLYPLLRQQLGDKLGPDFAGLRQPPVQDEERRDDRAPAIEVLVFPTWFTVDESAAPRSPASDDGSASAASEKRRRIVEFSDLTVTKAGKLSYKVDGKKAEVNPDSICRRLCQRPSAGHRLAFPGSPKW